MNFKPELAAKVMAGEKTVTRRMVSDNPRSPWFVDRVRIVSVRRELLGDLDDAEARREGFADSRAFVAAFEAINGSYADPDAPVWRVEFSVVPAEQGAFRHGERGGVSRAYWTCHRVSGGVKCGTQNVRRAKKCTVCGKTRPPVRRPKHMSALDLPYGAFLAANGGIERCGVCGVEPGRRNLQRDHEHLGDGWPRGLLCWRHNVGIEMFGDDPELLREAADYLERAARRRATYEEASDAA